MCIFLYSGGTIFDLITNSDFDYIHTKIKEDIKKALLSVNNDVVNYQVSVTPNFIYITERDIVEFNSLNNELIVTTQTGSKITLNMQNDVAKIIPLFSKLNKNFIFKSYSI